MHFVFIALFLFAGIKWGDWRRWRDYYPTILFFIIGDLLYSCLLYNHQLWAFQETFFGMSILRNDTIISLIIMFTRYPLTILIYLGRFPQTRVKQAFWMFFWIICYSLIEYLNLKYLNLINHYNGWNIWWSVLFNIAMFSILRIHYKKPLLAWGVSIVWILILWNVLNIPIEKIK
ncbi:CBO0543 family protein [Peribacillus frigoritolerans]|uniref:CBO0543 family protein n=1 Tax=Peribacillus frigoritolerans TaxID=450367 RepID=UPI002EA341FB|nr:CBO0543 family protein [Peribacillus frigoritolerans]